METEIELPQPVKNRNLDTGAKASLILLMFSVVVQLIAVYQTKYQLESPLIPESFIWKINNRFILIAFISALASLVALIFYFYKKYLWVIILAVLTLISERFIYI
jgi:hypothetical protein